MEFISSIFDKYGLIATLFIIFLEYACFPISSEIVLPALGALAKAKEISFFMLLPLSVLAGLLGTGVCYMIGRLGGSLLLDGLGKRFPKMQKGIIASRTKFDRYGAAAVCFLRVIPLCRTYIAFIAGTAKQPAPVYFSFSLLGITVWNCLLLSLGYFLQDNLDVIRIYYDKYKQILLPLALAFILFFFVKRIFKNRFTSSS